MQIWLIWLQVLSDRYRHQLRLFQVRRADIERFGRDLEAATRARVTVVRRLCTVAGCYKYAIEQEPLDHSPAVHVRRHRLDYKSHATGWTATRSGALFVASGFGPTSEHAFISLLALNKLRVSQATGADIEACRPRAAPHLAITRKGCKRVTIPLAPQTALHMLCLR